MHFVFYTFDVTASEESEENPPLRTKMKLMHWTYYSEITEGA